jgi:hypothetical protein
MKASDSKKDETHIQHDSSLGFQIWIGQGVLHIRAKDRYEPDASRTTIVADAGIEVVK